MRSFKTLILLFLAVLLLLALFRCRLLALGVRQVLLLQGAGNVTVRVTRLSLHRVRFSTIAFSLPLAGNRLSVSLDSLTATYDPETLSAGRLNTVSIDSLVLRLPEEPDTSPSSPFELPPYPENTAWQDMIPLRRLTIHRLRLPGKRAGILAGKDLALTMHADDRAVQGTLAMTSPGAPRLQLNVILSGNNRLDLRLTDGRENGRDASRMALYPAGDGGLAADFTLHLSDLARLALLPAGATSRPGGTLRGSGRITTGARPSFSLDIHSGAGGISAPRLERLSLHLEGVIRDHAGKIVLGPDSRLSLTGLQTPLFTVTTTDLALAGTYGRGKNGLFLSPSADRKWTMTGITAPGWHCERMAIKPTFSLTLQPGRATLALAESFRLEAVNLAGDSFRLAGLCLQPRQDTRIMFRPGHWSMRPGDWLLEPLAATARGFSAQFQQTAVALAMLEGGKGRWQARADLHVPGLVLAGHGRRVPLTDLLVHFEADNDRLLGKAAVSAGNLPGRIEALFQYQPAGAGGRAELRTSPPLRFGRNHPLAGLLPGLPLDLDQGTLTFTANASWSAGAPPSLQIDVNLDNGRGRFGELVFSGLDVRGTTRILPQVTSLAPTSITLNILDSGLRTEDIEAEITLQPSPAGRRPALHIERFAARLLGGRVSTSGLTLDPNNPDGRCTIAIRGIDLAEVVRLMQVKDLQVSGTVDGSLPVRLDKEGISIRDGELHNRPPGGVIRYQPEQRSSLAGMELTAYALKAMEDFRYNLLSARVEYRPDGRLDVALHMEGHSPKLETTRPVHLNINTEQNLLSLLKSLRYSRTLTDELDRSIRHHFNPDPAPP